MTSHGCSLGSVFDVETPLTSSVLFTLKRTVREIRSNSCQCTGKTSLMGKMREMFDINDLTYLCLSEEYGEIEAD